MATITVYSMHGHLLHLEHVHNDLSLVLYGLWPSSLSIAYMATFCTMTMYTMTLSMDPYGHCTSIHGHLLHLEQETAEGSHTHLGRGTHLRHLYGQGDQAQGRRSVGNQAKGRRSVGDQTQGRRSVKIHIREGDQAKKSIGTELRLTVGVRG